MEFQEVNHAITFEGQNISLTGLASTQWLEESTCREMDKLKRKEMVLQLIGEDELTWEQKLSEPLKEILHKFEDVFQVPQCLPPCRTHDHAINLLPGEKPVSVQPYRYPFFKRMKLTKLYRNSCTQGVIQPSQSSYTSPVLLVKKADGSWRMCVDYRALNQVTMKDKFPIPIVEELLDELSGSKLFS